LTKNRKDDIISTTKEKKESDRMEKIKNTYVLAIHKDRNGKEHFTVYENMETAKACTNSNTQKQFVTFVKKTLDK